MKVFIKSCLDGMREIKTNSVDLIITSPPYWDLKDYANDKQLGLGTTYETYVKYLEDCILGCTRVMKYDGFCVFNVADIRRNFSKSKYERSKLYSIQADIIKIFEKYGIELFSHIIWEKNSTKKGRKRYILYGSVDKSYIYPPYVYPDLDIEHILVFRKPGPLRKLEKYDERIDKLEKEMYIHFYNSVWKFDGEDSDIHPAVFPSELAKRIIIMFSLSGDVVFDPFAGSGTTLRVAQILNRKSLGYELNFNYIKNLVDEFNLVKNNDDEYENSTI